jgi:hypothetical protein
MTAPHNTPDPGWMGDRRRGAGMGRPSVKPEPSTARVYVALQRVKLNSGGYDQGGAYWGFSQILYWANLDGSDGWYFRAPSRDAAKAIVRETIPNARFAR